MGILLTALSVVGLAFGVLILLRRVALRKIVCKSKSILVDKTAIITGANTGIGLETAIELAKRRARVILACRNIEKAEQAVKEVKEQSGNENVVFYQLELDSLKSVRSFAAKVLECEPHVDILINNAGIMYPISASTQDGFELHMGVNHLGHFLLTNLLLDRIKESHSSRIVTVSSILYKYCGDEFDFENMNNMDPARLNPIRPQFHKPYCESKLANVIFTRELARRLEGTGVTANVVSPGIVRTELGRHLFQRMPFFMRYLFVTFFYLLLKTPREGAQTVIYCAVAEELEGLSGKLFRECKECETVTAAAMNVESGEKLWEVSSKLVSLNE